MACGAFYTASETLAPPGLIPAKRYSFSTASMRLSDSLLLLALMTTSAICAFYPGGVGRMAYGAFYAAGETLAPPGCWWWLFGWFWGFVLSILEGLEGWPAALFMWRARRSRPQDATAGRGLVAGRSSAGALTFYTASGTLARPGDAASRDLFAGGSSALTRSLFIRRAGRSRPQGVLLGGTYLPEGRALARSLFIRRARRSRPQGTLLVEAYLPEGRALARSLFMRRARHSRSQDARGPRRRSQGYW